LASVCKAQAQDEAEARFLRDLCRIWAVPIGAISSSQGVLMVSMKLCEQAEAEASAIYSQGAVVMALMAYPFVRTRSRASPRPMIPLCLRTLCRQLG